MIQIPKEVQDKLTPGDLMYVGSIGKGEATIGANKISFKVPSLNLVLGQRLVFTRKGHIAPDYTLDPKTGEADTSISSLIGARKAKPVSNELVAPKVKLHSLSAVFGFQYGKSI